MRILWPTRRAWKRTPYLSLVSNVRILSICSFANYIVRTGRPIRRPLRQWSAGQTLSLSVSQYVRSRMRSGVNPSMRRAASQSPPFSQSLLHRGLDSAFAEILHRRCRAAYKSLHRSDPLPPPVRTVVNFGNGDLRRMIWSRACPG